MRFEKHSKIRVIIKRNQGEVLIMTNNAVFSTGQVKSNIHLTNATRLRWSNEAKIDAGFADENDLFILRLINQF